MITATLDEQEVVVSLTAGHKGDGASFNRFGVLNVLKAAGGSGSLWVGNLSINGVAEPLDRDPGWEEFQNRRTYTTTNVRPCFDFGFSPTRYAGGKAAGEMGGLIFRGDERFLQRMAYYGDRIGPLTLDRSLRASGKVCLRRGVTDSTTLIGFFHAPESMRVSIAQKSAIPENFLGVAIEGPSQEGFYFYPAYGLNRDTISSAGRRVEQPPHILPDGKPHDWTLEYSPAAANGQGRISVTLDGHAARIDLRPGEKSIGARFNRFGIITTPIDGNGQNVYLDDLTYMVSASGER
ncbi:MAG: hypothetical protein FJ388_01935 [Verrucomicrobia bacterium]|nr:hypothetical protein [Verrucomicrobiota bacterium]